jgi:serine/threonine-protein phosphatase 2B catalytic subunit
MWADPVENDTGEQAKEWVENKKRCCSFIFGKTAVNNFLESNNLLCVVRAHEV